MANVRDPIDAVLIDLDDTLNDRSASWRNWIAKVGESHNCWRDSACLDDIHARIIHADQRGYRPKPEFIQELAESLPWRSMITHDAFEELWRSNFPACMQTRDGANELFDHLKSRDIRTAIVTNGRGDVQTAKIETMGLAKRCDVIVISDVVGFKKPDRRIYEYALNALGCTAAHALFIGDDPERDIIGPAELGMRTAWLAHGREWESNRGTPDFVLKNLSDLLLVIG